MGILRVELVLCVGLAMAGGAQAAQPQRSIGIQPEAWQVVQLANQARAAQGAGPLKWDEALAAAARQHCLLMAEEGPISHRYGGEADWSVRAGAAGAHFSLIEENVAIGPTPAGIHNEWMHSEGHRTNLLNPEVDRVGVALVASRGVLYAVADYAKGVPVLTLGQVEATIGAQVRAKGVGVVENPATARAACAMDRGFPKGDNLQPRFVMRWQDANIAQLPPKLVDQLASGQYRKAAVGSCPAQYVEGAFTVYRAAVLLY